MNKKFYLPTLATFLLLAYPMQAFAASLSLSPTTGTFNKGCSFNLDIVLDTSGVQTDGSDALLFYDAAKFTADSVTNGSIYPDFPGNSIDEQNGKITISGLSSVASAFSGKGNLATIKFTVKDTASIGATQVRFDFDPQDKTKTTDSNVVERGTVADVLSSVTNGNYVVGSGSCAAQGQTGGGTGSVSTGSGQVKPTVIPQDKTLPDAGMTEITTVVTILGGILTVLGILGLSLL